MKAIISPIEIARVYLESEFNKLFPGVLVADYLHTLPEKELWRLLEALSFSYRLNGVFWYLSDDGLEWTEEAVNSKQILLTGINKQIDTLIAQFDNDPLRFRDYLRNYFRSHTNGYDPEGLYEFYPKEVPKWSKIILVEKDEDFKILDGSHRLISLLLQGQFTILSYVGRRVRTGKVRVGDSTVWLLKKLYEKGNEDEKQAVILIVRKLVSETSDAQQAILDYLPQFFDKIDSA